MSLRINIPVSAAAAFLAVAAALSIGKLLPREEPQAAGLYFKMPANPAGSGSSQRGVAALASKSAGNAPDASKRIRKVNPASQTTEVFPDSPMYGSVPRKQPGTPTASGAVSSHTGVSGTSDPVILTDLQETNESIHTLPENLRTLPSHVNSPGDRDSSPVPSAPKPAGRSVAETPRRSVAATLANTDVSSLTPHEQAAVHDLAAYEDEATAYAEETVETHEGLADWKQIISSEADDYLRITLGKDAYIGLSALALAERRNQIEQQGP